MKNIVVLILLSCFALLGIGCAGSSTSTVTTDSSAIEGPAFVLFFTEP